MGAAEPRPILLLLSVLALTQTETQASSGKCRVRRETTSEARRAAPRKAQHPARPARSLAGLPSLAPPPHPCLTVPLVGCPTPLQVCGPARGSPGKGSGSHGKSPPGSHSLRYFVTTTSLFCYHDVRSRDPGAPSHHRRLRGQHRVHEL